MKERAGAPNLSLQSGGVRVIDTRETLAEAFRVDTPHVSALGRGTDTELWVRADDTRICNHEERLELASVTGDRRTELGRICAEAGAGGVAPVGPSSPAIDVGPENACEFRVADLAELLLPGISEPPLELTGFPTVGPTDDFDPCTELTAQGCLGIDIPPTPPPSPPPTPRRRPVVVDTPAPSCGGPGIPCN